MQIFVQVKQLGKRRDVIKKHPLNLSQKPLTLKELLDSIVELSVEQFNDRTEKDSDSTLLNYLAKENIDDMAAAGKVSFGLNYNGKKADLATAQQNVHEAFTDGLFRIFLNENELTDLTAPLQLTENDTLIFIRLVMLAGRM